MILAKINNKKKEKKTRYDAINMSKMRAQNKSPKYIRKTLLKMPI